MKKKLFFGVSIAALMLASCGGAEEATDETSENGTETTDETVGAVTYEIDTEASVINWNNVEGGEKGHWGTVKVLSGSFTVDEGMITSASLSADMNTISADDEMGGEKLAGHLASPSFFDVNQYASADFTFDKHEDGVIFGSLSAGGLEFAIEAGASVTDGTVEISDFEIEMAELGFFVEEKEKETDEAKWHNTSIVFSASIVGK